MIDLINLFLFALLSNVALLLLIAVLAVALLIWWLT